MALWGQDWAKQIGFTGNPLVQAAADGSYQAPPTLSQDFIDYANRNGYTFGTRALNRNDAETGLFQNGQLVGSKLYRNTLRDTGFNRAVDRYLPIGLAAMGAYGALGGFAPAGGAAGGSAADLGMAGLVPEGTAWGAGSASGIGAGTAVGGSGMFDGLGSLINGGGGWANLAGNLIGAAIGSDSARSAANTQADATREAIGEQRRQYDLTRSDFAPWREAGVGALGTLQKEMGAPVTAADVMQDPGYQFGLTSGQQAIDRKIAAGGGRMSGAAVKAAGRFGTDYATTGYNAAYQRRQDRLNRLQALAGIGQTATNSSAQAGQGATNAISSLISSGGDAAAAGRMAQGNIWGNAVNSITANYMRNQQRNPNAINPQFGLPNYAIDPYGN